MADSIQDEIVVRLSKDEAKKIVNFAGIKKVCGSFMPEHDPIDRLALVVVLKYFSLFPKSEKESKDA